MDDEKYIKPRHKKIDKHFTININNRKVRILNYNINSYLDSIENCEYQEIEIITKIYNEVLDNRTINITIVKDDKIIKILGVYDGALLKPGLLRYSYKIDGYVELPRRGTLNYN